MKTSQMFSIVVTLIIAVGLVTFLGHSAPSFLDATIPTGARQHGSEDDMDPEKFNYESENPFDLTGPGPHPKAEVPEPIHNFGDMLLDETGRHDFVFRNTGKVPLKIAKGPAQCKCTVSGIATDEIPPGAEATVHLEWKPKTLGNFGQQAVIWTNDPESPAIALRVEGIMHQEVVAEPANGWVLGTVSKNEPAEFKAAIFSAIRKDFHILKAEATSPSITLTWRELNDEEKAASGTDYGFAIEGSLAPDGTVGRFHERVTVTTDLEKHPTFKFDLTANRQGPISFVGKEWISGNQQLDLKDIDQSQGKSSQVTMLIDRFDGQLEFKEIKTNPGFLEVDVTAAENNGGSSRDRYTLTVKVPPDSPLGIWGKGHNGSIVIETNHPDVKEISLSVQMDIVASKD